MNNEEAEMVDDAGEIDSPQAALSGEDESFLIRPSGRHRAPPDAEPGLPVWTATTTSPAVDISPPAPIPQHRRRRRTVVLVALTGLVLLAMSGTVGWLLGRSQTPSETDATKVAIDAGPARQSDTASNGQTDAAGDSGAEMGSGTSTSALSSAGTGSTVIPTSSTISDEPLVVAQTPDNPLGAIQYAVMTGGKAVMRGWYPTPEMAATAVQDATTIMGPGNVIDETQVDGRAEIDPASFAVYFEDYILFERDSATITPEFFELLSYPLIFMQQGPHAIVTVVARTDASGTAAYNLELAERRAEAVRDHWLANGGNADQIILDPRGEEGAEEGIGDDQARQDRRVELIVSGFLAG